MQIKLLYQKFYLSDNVLDIKYIPKIGTIISPECGKIIHHIPFLEMPPYFYFKLEFDTYKYQEQYQSKTDSYQKQITSKVYNFNLYINIDFSFNHIIVKSIVYYFLNIQMERIASKKKYWILEKNVKQFVENNDKELAYLIPWNYFQMNDKYFCDMREQKIISTESINKIKFTVHGGIIETNHLSRLIKKILPHVSEHFDQTLIIYLDGMINPWKNSQYHLSWSKLITLDNSNLQYYRKIGIKRLVIHDFYQKYAPDVKYILKYLACTHLWVINSLPLPYYFSTNSKLTVNQLSSLINCWANFDKGMKKKCKTSIINHIHQNFNKHYVRMYYPQEFVNQRKNIKLSSYESEIYQKFNQSYSYWKKHMVSNKNNIYTITTKKEDQKLEFKIFQTFVILITSVVEHKNLPKFFNRKIELLIEQSNQIMNAYQHEQHRTYRYLLKYEDLNKQHQLDLSHYQRFLSNNFILSSDQSECPICYCDDVTKIMTICGHVICLDCILNTLRQNNRCPLCNQTTNINTLAIVKETIPPSSNISELLTFYNQLSKDDLIVTDLKYLSNILETCSCESLIIDIYDQKILDRIDSIRIRKIYLFESPDYYVNKKKKRRMNQIIEFIKIFNQNAIIINVKLFN